jgi:uncharacterized protein YjiS (DUF1127 family)
MIASIARQAAYGAAELKRAFTWLAQVGAARASMAQLARMSDAELHDIGLVRQDVVDIGALRRSVERSALAERRAAPRGAKLAA